MVGVDIVSIKRIEDVMEKKRQRFLDRVLDSDEQKLANSAQNVAGFWAAKEAVAKALGCGIGEELSFLDIKLHKKKSGQPYFSLPKSIMQRYSIKDTSISIAHDGGFAIAVAAIERG